VKIDSSFKRTEIRGSVLFYKQSGKEAIIYVPAKGNTAGKQYTVKYAASCGWYLQQGDLDDLIRRLGFWDTRMFRCIEDKLLESMKQQVFNIFEEE
jgi:hypothetical protein